MLPDTRIADDGSLSRLHGLVASIYHLPPRILPSIQHIEGGSSGIVRTNANGSQDTGVMQVNTIWLPVLARCTGLTEPALRERLTNRACFNTVAAGLIFGTYLDEAHDDVMFAIGDYHSHTPVHKLNYRSLVRRAADKTFVPGMYRPDY